LCTALLWTAPELGASQRASATGLSVVTHGTQKGDVYSFAIILHEILYRSGIFRCFEDDEQIPAKSESVDCKTTRNPYKQHPKLPEAEDMLNIRLNKIHRNVTQQVQL